VEEDERNLWMTRRHALLEKRPGPALELGLGFLGAHSTGVEGELESVEEFGQVG